MSACVPRQRYASVVVFSVLGIVLGTYASLSAGLSHVTSLDTVCQ